MVQDILSKYEGKADQYQIARYQSLVGSINYPAVITRPDVAYAASKLAEHLQNPGLIHIAAVERCIRYLDTTRYYTLEFGANNDITPTFESGIELLYFVGYSDASFIDNIDTRRSTQGYKFELFGGTIDWQVKKQPTVATSSTEAELQALATVSM